MYNPVIPSNAKSIVYPILEDLPNNVNTKEIAKWFEIQRNNFINVVDNLNEVYQILIYKTHDWLRYLILNNEILDFNVSKSNYEICVEILHLNYLKETYHYELTPTFDDMIDSILTNGKKTLNAYVDELFEDGKEKINNIYERYRTRNTGTC